MHICCHISVCICICLSGARKQNIYSFGFVFGHHQLVSHLLDFQLPYNCLYFAVWY